MSLRRAASYGGMSAATAQCPNAVWLLVVALLPKSKFRFRKFADALSQKKTEKSRVKLFRTSRGASALPRKRLKYCAAAKRRDGPKPDSCSAAKLIRSPRRR